MYKQLSAELKHTKALINLIELNICHENDKLGNITHAACLVVGNICAVQTNHN